jgi:hypothetical protein
LEWSTAWRLGGALLLVVVELKGGRLALAETTNTADLPRPFRSGDLINAVCGW